VAQPLRLRGQVFGALIVAEPKDELRDQWLTLIERLALAFVVAILVVGALAVYLSRRITRPVLELADAADEIAGGNYAVAIPEVPGGGEIEDLAERFRQMASRLSEAEEQERNFLMSVSHELRTPLTAIRGHVEALREGLADDPGARTMSLDVIAAEGARLERLVGDVLDLAKLDARRFTVLREEVDMAQLLERAYTVHGEEARRRGIDYRAEVGSRPVIVSDGDRVLQIVSNLLDNAFRWTPDGGMIGLSLLAEDGTVAVEVSDTGPGIQANERERIFRPFWSRDGAGTGLGLAIANELAVALGGRIDLDTEPGRGSRFVLVLPSL
jgi:two-component system, OmpR family, sensor kinase